MGQRLRDRGQTFPDVRQSQLSLDLGVSTFLLFLPPTQSSSLSHGVLMFRPSPLDSPLSASDQKEAVGPITSRQ